MTIVKKTVIVPFGKDIPEYIAKEIHKADKRTISVNGYDIRNAIEWKACLKMSGSLLVSFIKERKDGSTCWAVRWAR